MDGPLPDAYRWTDGERSGKHGRTGAVPAEGAPNGGGPGDPLLLSRVNQAGPMTVLKTNGGFRILAKNPKRPPLMVYTPDSMPPFDVSSQAKVENLNVDLLDGKNVEQVRPSVAWWSNDKLPAQDFNVERTVTVPPGGGTLVMIGSLEIVNYTTAAASIGCWFNLDGGSPTPPGGWTLTQAASINARPMQPETSLLGPTRSPLRATA
jgi:hypothetical protein